MYKRETKAQFNKRIAEMQKQKPLTPKQLEWEIEARKLRNRLATAEKRGFHFDKEIVGQRPQRVTDAAIAKLKKIKGNKQLLKKAEYLDAMSVITGDVKLRASKKGRVGNLGVLDGKLVITSQWWKGATGEFIPVTQKMLETVGPSTAKMRELLEESDIKIDVKSELSDEEKEEIIKGINIEDETEESDEEIFDDSPDFYVPDEIIYGEKDPQEEYAKRNADYRVDNDAIADEGYTILHNIYSVLESAPYINGSDTHLSGNNAEIKESAIDECYRIIQSAINTYGERNVVMKLAENGEVVTKTVEKICYLYYEFDSTRTEMMTRNSLNEFREMLFAGDYSAQLMQEFEEYDNLEE